MRILIKNAKIWNGELFFYGDILTEDTRISLVADPINREADFTFDANGKIVSAGLIDIHTHLKNISPASFGMPAEMCSFPFGVTAVFDAGGISGNKALMDSFHVKSGVFVFLEVKNNHIVAVNAEKCLKDYGDKAAGLKLVFDSTNRDIYDITPLKEASEYAKRHDLRLTVHCSNSPAPMYEIVNALKCGDVLTHVYHGGKNKCSEDGYQCFRTAKKKGVIMDTGFAGHVHTDFRVLKNAIKSGFFPNTISTDITCLSAFIRGGRYGMTTCMSIMKTVGMGEDEIFKACTSTPAGALGRDMEMGYLKAGRTADIAVFDYVVGEGFDLTDAAGNHLYSDSGYRCVLTISDGQIVYRA